MITRFGLPIAGAVLLATLVPVEAIKVPTSCYVPNGDPRTNHRPCYTDTADGHSHCCDPINEVCLDNGLCFSQGPTNPGYLYRDSCTDKGWTASSCPGPCRKTYTNSACPIVGILDPSQDSSFCCLSFNATANACYGEVAAFNVGKVIPNWGPLEAAASSSTASGTQSTASPTSATSAPAAATVTVVKSNSSSGHDAAIGAGVGVPLGILLVASLAGLLFQHRRHKKQLAQWQQSGNVAGVAHQEGGVAYPLQDPKTTYQPAAAYQTPPQPQPQPQPQPAYEMPNVERTELA
ncbi:uncharacterized protein BDZ99DRAFT_465258 [Mytilinidion resinicola]|uniref:Mid2 domain-containing protein n=1 Tax=Mytilinidion resinicola TaxID=574789 RepID=A0A6A6YH75_9PEZI|nr:uncharacterized protein BDZ99DRAFT_465258 [Mytilinidion resinicola]KAF2807354.1 hypothetical protein BDZ99DRAFT_465258 [Mytilinidion resinicola]